MAEIEKLKRRVDVLEEEIAELKRRIHPDPDLSDWPQFDGN